MSIYLPRTRQERAANERRALKARKHAAQSYVRWQSAGIMDAHTYNLGVWLRTGLDSKAVAA